MSEWTLTEKITFGVLVVCFLAGLAFWFNGNSPAPSRRALASPNSASEGVVRISLLLLVIYGYYMVKKYGQSDYM